MILTVILTIVHVIVCLFLVVVVLLQFSGVLPSVGKARAAGTIDFRVGYLQAVDSLNPFMGQEDASYVFYSMVYDFLFSPERYAFAMGETSIFPSLEASSSRVKFTRRGDVTNRTREPKAFLRGTACFLAMSEMSEKYIGVTGA